MAIINLLPTAYSLGIFSTLGFTLTLSPVIISFTNYQICNKILQRVSYWGLIAAIFFALSHGLLMTQKDNIDFYNLKTYWTYAEGLLALNFLIMLAFNFTKIQLDRKRFAFFIYALLFLVVCHLIVTILG